MPPSAGSLRPIATLRTNQPWAQGIDPPDRFGRSLVVRRADLAGNSGRLGFTAS
jgi:hypothetical protein